MLRFSSPTFLALLPLLAWGLFWSWRHIHGIARPRKILAFALRAILGSALILALAGPESRRPNSGLCTIFLLDRSDSVSERDRARSEKFVNEALQKLEGENSAAVIVFGREARVESSPGGRRSLGPILTKIDPSDSDLAGAVRLATATFPEGKGRRIVLLSDGNETRGEFEGAAQVAATDGIPLDVVPLGGEPPSGETSVIGMEVPNERRVDEPFDLRVAVESTVETPGTLDIDRDGVLIKRVPVQLRPGRNSLVVPQTLTEEGFHRFRATLRTTRDHDVRNNIGMGFVSVRGKPRALVLQESLRDQTLVSALTKSGILVDQGDRGTLPTQPEELQRYDAIFFNDINAAGFTRQQMLLFQSAVRDAGVGFAMVGGENSFLPGGWYGTPIADVLPVDLNIRQRKSFPSTSICIMVDTSGSMGMVEDGKTKLRLAAEAAEQTVRLMSPLDRVGVAGSTDGIEFVAPMQRLDNKSSVISQIQRLEVGGGGIYIGPTVQRAEQVLRAEQSKVRHLLILADGNDSTDEQDAILRVTQMRLDKITTSVVAIGSGDDVPLLRAVAAAGGGRFYLAKRAAQLPAIFTQDAALMSRSAIEEGAFFPKVNFGNEIVRGVAEDGLPPLLAYCLTDTRPLSRIGMRTQKDDPLLATWQYGLGTSLAFTSDASPRWAQKWVSWPGFAAYWAQTARAISRRATLGKYQVAVRKENGKGIVEVKATDKFGNPLDASDADVRIATPNGASKEVTLSQDAPGSFVGSFDAGETGTYIATIAEKTGSEVRTSSSGFSIAYPPEYANFRTNRPLLARSAEVTGGKELTKPSEALRSAPTPGVSIQELWRQFLTVALLLLPVDIAIRRLALPLSEIWLKLRNRFSKAPTPPAAPEVVDRLRQAKSRAATPTKVVTPIVINEDNPKPKTEPSSPTTTGDTARDLLERRRQRRG